MALAADRTSRETGIDRLLAETFAGSKTHVNDGETLPPAAYMSQEFFDLEMSRIFRREWHCLGHVSQIPNVGDYVVRYLLGEPIIVVRGPDRVRALSGVCLHRWAPVASGKGNTKIFSCPFHKWGYALDGQLLGAPFMERAAEFQPKDCRLPEIRSEIVAGLGLIFVTLSEEASSISDRLASLCEHAAAWNVQDQIIVETKEFDNKFNWKIQVETYMECYHHIGAHRESLESISPGGLSWCEEDKGGWTVCHSGLKPNLSDEDRKNYEPTSLVLIYPLTMLGMNSQRVDLQTLVPVGPNRTLSTWYFFMPRDEAATPEGQAKLQQRLERNAVINAEDLEVNDMQQFGAASRLAKPGRFSHLEACSWHLSEYVRNRLRAN